MIWTIAALLLLVLPSVAEAASFYVDSASGRDTHNGATPATAWRSLEKVGRTTFQPGDRLLLRSGSAWSGPLHPQGCRLWPPRSRLGRRIRPDRRFPPCLNAGLPVPANGGRDFWGNPVSDLGATSIGAYSGVPVPLVPVVGK